MKILYFLWLMTIVSCYAERNQYREISQNVKKRNGRWIEKYEDAGGTYISKGRYTLGEKVGVWKTFFNGKLLQKDKISGDITKTKIYCLTGKVWQKGQSKLEISPSERHWYYFGDWRFYDEKGRLHYIKKYNFGKKTDSIAIH